MLWVKISRPDVRVIWHKGYQELEQNRRVVIRRYIEGINILIITSATYDDSGIYKVMLENNHKLLSSATVEIDCE